MSHHEHGSGLQRPTSVAGPAWYPDPGGRHRVRYWDGARWTEHVGDGGPPSLDPLWAGGPRPDERHQDQARTRPGCLTAVLAALGALATFAVIAGGVYLVLRTTGQSTDPPWWLRPVALGAAIAVALGVLQRRLGR